MTTWLMKIGQKANNIMIKSIIKSVSIFAISLMVFFVYESDFSILNEDYYLILGYIFTISIISYYFYESESSYKKKHTNSISIKIFKYVSEFIYISSILISINSILIDNFLSLEFHDNINIVYMGISLSAISIALFISAKISLGTNYSPCFDHKKPNKIVDTGLYGYIRHPIYTANILLVLSILIISGSYFLIINLFLITIFYLVSAFREEKYLVSKFSGYRRYSSKTGMFIPRYKK